MTKFFYFFFFDLNDFFFSKKGIFLYVAIVELIVEEFESPDYKMLKMLLLALGYAFMSVLGLWL